MASARNITRRLLDTSREGSRVATERMTEFSTLRLLLIAEPQSHRSIRLSQANAPEWDGGCLREGEKCWEGQAQLLRQSRTLPPDGSVPRCDQMMAFELFLPPREAHSLTRPAQGSCDVLANGKSGTHPASQAQGAALPAVSESCSSISSAWPMASVPLALPRGQT